MAKRIQLRRLTRVSVEGNAESLSFRSGLNVIVGAPNTGKSSWFRLIDYLFGDDDPPAKALKRRVADGFVSAQLDLTIDDREVALARNWHEPGRSKVAFEGMSLGPDEFSDAFLEAAGLPRLRIPKGSPYSTNTWPRLSWRLLLRHIYRHEYSWNDIADKQPAADQHAALMVFLGEATRLFPVEYGQMIDAQRKRMQLEARKEQFVSTLDEISRELLNLQEATVSLTAVGLDRAEERLKDELQNGQRRRDQLIEESKRAAVEKSASGEEQARVYEEVGQQLVELRMERERLVEKVAKGGARRTELESHRTRVADQLTKFIRLKAASDVLSDLRVSHCPSCDQPVERSPRPGQCHLCLQPVPVSQSSTTDRSNRVGFEEEQLQTEASELGELIGKLSVEEGEWAREIRTIDDRIREGEMVLQPARRAASWVLSPEVTRIDYEQGRIGEQLRQLERIRHVLARRDALNQDIDQLSAEIVSLDAQVKTKAAGVRLSRGAELLERGMNDYLNALNSAEKQARWQSSAIQVRLSEGDVRFLIGGRDWREDVGGTYTCYFLAAYNYALLSLTGQEGTAYPGFGMIDLPPNLSDIKLLTDQETYLVEPFAKLLGRTETAGTQLLITGHAYSGLPGVNRIDLQEVFAQTDEDEDKAE